MTDIESSVQKLLILDDDLMTGQTIQRIGEFAGLESVHTVSAIEFLDLVEKWSPDVLALDLLMPGMDGVEVMARLSELECQADLIITSGVDERVLNAAGRSATGHGLNTLGVLSKPFLPARLRELLARSGQKSSKARSVVGPYNKDPTAADLRAAIDARQITVAYQPKIYCRTGTLAGVEALARWSFNGNPVPPDRFIVLAEQNGLIDDLTRLVFEQALRWLAARGESPRGPASGGLGQASLSLNISARTLTNDALFRWVVALCDELDIERHRVIFELTESSAMGDTVTAMDTLTRLRMQGFHLSIDDFGTGFSSMVQLVRLPFSEIKVDKSFVMNSQTSAESRAISRSIVDLGKSLGLLSTAEGVEDQGTLEYLKELGCDLAQGYYISRPMNGEDVLAWYSAREQERESFRRDAVRDSAMFGTAPERRFDRITDLARRLFNVPICLITFLDKDREWIKSRSGFAASELPRSESFCTHTIEVDGTFVVNDPLDDARFRELELVRGPQGIRFYAGQSVCLPNGAKIGALCLLDRTHRDFSTRDIQVLKYLAEMVEVELAEKVDSRNARIRGDLSRISFRSRADKAVGLAEMLGEGLTVILFRLEELDDINRKLGRAMGDRCLQAAADVIDCVVEVPDLVGRYSGGEMVVVRMGADQVDAQSIFNDLERAFEHCQSRIPIPVRLLISVAHLDQTGHPAALEMAVEKARESEITFELCLRG